MKETSIKNGQAMQTEKQKQEKISTTSTFKRLLAFCQPEVTQILVGFSALAINAATNLSFPWILGEAVDQSRIQDEEQHVYFLVGTAGIFIVASAASFVRVYCLASATESISSRFKKLVFGNLIEKNMDFFDTNRKGQLISVLDKDVALASEVLTDKLASGLRSLNSSINGSILLFSISPYLFSISIGILPLIGVGAMKISKYSKILAEKARAIEASILSFAIERFSSMTTIRLNGRERFEVSRYGSQLDDFNSVVKGSSLAKSSLMSFINFSTNMSLCVVLYVGGKMLRNGRLTPGALTKFALQSAFVGLGFSGLSVFYDDMRKGLDAAKRIFSLLDEEVDLLTTDAASTTANIVLLKADQTIELRHISFQYKNRDAPILNDLNLVIEPRSITAIAGRSGSGKSTIMAILAGLYVPDKGSIIIGDVSSPTELRKSVGVVEQTAGLLSGTITSNIAYGKDGATMDEIELAARLADAHDFISALPDGYNTQIGEMGSLLSGGQKARIALARALVKDPSFLLLDEATSSLDKASENEIIATLQRYCHIFCNNIITYLFNEAFTQTYPENYL